MPELALFAVSGVAKCGVVEKQKIIKYIKVMTQKSNNEQLNTVKYEDAVAASKVYFAGDDLAAQVWVSKYALKDSFGNIYETTPVDMHNRIAKELARIENNYPNPLTEAQIFELLDHFRYVIPQGGPMTGIGNNMQVASLSNLSLIHI